MTRVVINRNNIYRCLQNIVRAVLSLQVSKIYKDKSIGNPMHIAVVKLVVLRDVHFVESRNRMGNIGASDMLHRFCEWQSYHNDENDSSENHHDSALLLTRYNVHQFINAVVISVETYLDRSSYLYLV